MLVRSLDRFFPNRTIHRFRNLRSCAARIVAAIAVTCVPGPGSPPAAGQELTGLQAAAAIESVLVDTIAKAEKSVVAVSVVRNAPLVDRSATSDPEDSEFLPTQYGTGIVLRKEGLVLTNYHLLPYEKESHKDYKFFITTADRNTYEARIKAYDPRSDLAVLEPIVGGGDGRPRQLSLTPITLGDAKPLRKGQIVVALGNPYAIARDGQASASWGIIANLARKAGPESDDRRVARSMPTLHHYGTLIQTDAKLNLGTSGGPLVNLKGEMVGLTTSMAAIAGYEQSAGYAIPVNDLFRRVAADLAEGREVTYGFLGVETRDLAVHQRRAGRHGMMVGTVIRGTPAAEVGLISGDIITRVNDEPIVDKDQFVLAVNAHRPRDRIRLTVERRIGNRELRVHMEPQLTKYRVDGPKIVTNQPPAWRGMRVDFATAVVLIRPGEYSIPGQCVAVSEVDKESPAWKAGLRPGVLISHVGNSELGDPRDFRAAVSKLQGTVSLMRIDQGPLGTIDRTEVEIPSAADGS
jgi:S1-C subfamily serine protease